MEIVVISQSKHQVRLLCCEKNVVSTKFISINGYSVLKPARNAGFVATIDKNYLILDGLQADTLYHININCSLLVNGRIEQLSSVVKFVTGKLSSNCD